MQASECSFKKGAISYTSPLINIYSAGLVDGDKLMWKGPWSFFQDDVDFTRYYQDLMYNYNKTATVGCSNHDYCLGLKASFYWTAMPKDPWSFECQEGKACMSMLIHTGKGWSASQSNSSINHDTNHTTQAFDVRYLRNYDPPKQTLTFISYGPSEVQVFFNEVLVALKMQMIREDAGGYTPIEVLRICKFNPDKIPEGIFAIRYKK
ncbi:hypothetical protein DSO57_1018803 [Entomophthora muscae]|uniref:Uncharacterized protein n=1 Tax=Entomophthora muscae TaxID=34485 RepID=A0ACC2T4E3_9FUNG|nr:hypothetical protein DSO57_1018803 [Entomophthora muscae]